MPRIDFTNVKDSFEPIPVGIYEATLYNIELKESRDSGQPYYNFEYAIQTKGFEGRRVFDVNSLQPNALWKLKHTLETLGGAKIPQEEFSFEPSDWLGKACRIKIKHEQYNGQTYDRVDQILPVGAGATAGNGATPAASGRIFGGKRG